MNSTLLNKFIQLEHQYLSEVGPQKPQVGYLCMRIPVELIEAMDSIPRRIVVQPGFDVNGCTSIRSDGCSFCRSVPSILKLDQYKNLKAVIGGSCCDQMRRLLDTLHTELDIPVILFSSPRTWQNKSGFFLREMTNAFKQLTAVTGKAWDDETLLEKIIIRNKLKKRIKSLRSKAILSNNILSEIASSCLPADKILDFLNHDQIEQHRTDDNKVNILMAGSIPGLWEQEIVEQAGGRIVMDTTCLGDRLFVEETCEQGDLLFNLYQSYIEKNLCPHRRPVQPLIDYIMQTIAESKRSPQTAIHGVIYRSLKYCHPYGLNAARIKRYIDLPFLKIDDDLTSAATGNLRTRIEAFIEMIKIRRKAKG